MLTCVALVLISQIHTINQEGYFKISKAINLLYYREIRGYFALKSAVDLLCDFSWRDRKKRFFAPGRELMTAQKQR